jgi:hypothetical protein
MLVPCVSTFTLEDYLKLASQVNQDIIDSYSFERVGETQYKVAVLLKAVSVLPPTHIHVQVEKEENRYIFNTPPMDAKDFVIEASGSFTIVQHDSFEVEYNVCFENLPSRIETLLHRLLTRAITRLNTFINENINTSTSV